MMGLLSTGTGGTWQYTCWAEIVHSGLALIASCDLDKFVALTAVMIDRSSTSSRNRSFKAGLLVAITGVATSAIVRLAMG